MPRAFSAKAVANYFLDLASQSREAIDPLKMQKLVYFAHGWHLALRNAPLIRDAVEAWEHGPVIPDIYHEFKRWGSGAIERPATRFDALSKSLTVPSIDVETVWDADAANAKTIIRRVWEVYRKFNGLQLSSLTHQADTPWAATKAKYPHKRDVDIPDDLIRDYFRAQIPGNVPAHEPVA
jgi:uncharacterized phage-associated protein